MDSGESESRDRGDYKSSWNTAMYSNEQLYEVQNWCQHAAMNYQYRDWAKALFRYLTILSPLMESKETEEVMDDIRQLRSLSANYSSSQEDMLFDGLTMAESQLRIIQNERGLGFALDEVQRVVEGDDEGVDKMIDMMQQREDMLADMLARQKRMEAEDNEEVGSGESS